VTAAGLALLFMGGLELTVDGAAVKPSERLTYQGMMLEGVPNLAMAIGYTNASWTLKCDLTCQAVARILNRPLHYFLGEDGDMLYVKDSDIAELIGELEKRPEDLPELLSYWNFLRWRRMSANGNSRH